MRIALASVQVPFIRGGAEILADELKRQLKLRGHQVDIISMPFKWYPVDTMYDSMMMGRMMDLSQAAYEKIDGVIALKFPAYYARHPNKSLWLVHQHRQAYDLWNTQFGDLHQTPEGQKLAKFIHESDNYFFPEFTNKYTISQNVTDRLMKFNHIQAETLYHPPQEHEKLFCASYDNYIFYCSRIDQMKRQRLLIEAARHLKSDVQIKIAGTGSEQEMKLLKKMIEEFSLEKRVTLLGFIDDKQKYELYSKALAVYYGAVDEDYGYGPLEALYSSKAVIVHPDVGGPLEFVSHGKNGLVVEADPSQLASAIDQLSLDKNISEKMGQAGLEGLKQHQISWDNVIQKLTATF